MAACGKRLTNIFAKCLIPPDLNSPAAELTASLRLSQLPLIVPIIHGPTAEVTATGFTFLSFFFYLCKLEVQRKRMEILMPRMSYSFDFDLSSNRKLKK